jgi:hypothetical protein
MSEQMELSDEWDGPCFTNNAETKSLLPSECKCSNTDVSTDCVIRAIEDWNHTTTVLCPTCFVNTPIDSAHQCLCLSRTGFLDRTYDKLRQLQVRNKIYVHYLNKNHSDFAHMWENFCVVYTRVINNRK